MSFSASLSFLRFTPTIGARMRIPLAPALTERPRFFHVQNPARGLRWASAKHSHTTHVSGTAKIYYPHHPNCGQAVTLVRRCASFGPGLVQVELPQGDQLLVADWMLDEHSCYGMDVMAEPRLDIAALLELRELVDLHLSRPENAVASEASSTGGASREPTPSGSSSLDDPIEAGTSPREPTALP
jgi:hypothetical protein